MNQKKSPEIDYSPISGSSYVVQLYYCKLNICSLMLNLDREALSDLLLSSNNFTSNCGGASAGSVAKQMF